MYGQQAGIVSSIPGFVCLLTTFAVFEFGFES